MCVCVCVGGGGGGNWERVQIKKPCVGKAWFFFLNNTFQLLAFLFHHPSNSLES